MKVPIVVCRHCGWIHQDVPPIFKKDPRVTVEVVYGSCPELCTGRLEMLRQLAKMAERRLNKNAKKAQTL